MTGPSTGVDGLDARSQVDVLDAVAAVETANAPVAVDEFRGLRDPQLRQVVDAELRQVGRCLVACDGGWLSGYEDDTAAAVFEDGGQTLTREDRAVLAAVLLLTVAVPRAAGEIDSRDWTAAAPISSDKLKAAVRLPERTIARSLRRLREMGVLPHGRRSSIQPGPQFLRLTEKASRRLWAELVAVADPDGLLADQLRADPTILDEEMR